MTYRSRIIEALDIANQIESDIANGTLENSPICNRCGKPYNLQWRQSKAGKWYLWDNNTRKPHFLSCGN